MKIQKVTARDAAFQKFVVLRTNRNKRYKYRQFFVEGVRNLNEAVHNGWQIDSFLYTREKPLSRWAQEMLARVPTQVNFELTAELMAELSGKTDTSELMAVVHMREDSLETLRFSPCPVVALFDRPSNKGNLGTVLRSCDALGVEALLITGHAVDLYDPDTVVSTMGSFFNMQAVRVADNASVEQFIADMKRRYPGFLTVGTTAHRQTSIYQVDLTRPVLLMIGNETDGLCARFKEICDVQATIPMAETSFASSFNVACAASILFAETQRQRSAAQGAASSAL